MGCGSSTPVKSDRTTSTTASGHAKMRTRAGDGSSQLDIGPNYKAIKHLGARTGCRPLVAGSMLPPVCHECRCARCKLRRCSGQEGQRCAAVL